MRITKEVLEALKTEKGGWTKEVLTLLGVPWPPPKGWKKKLINDEPIKPKKKKGKSDFCVTDTIARDFYNSRKWAHARYRALKKSDGKCELCGCGKRQGRILNVDHIKSLKRFWHLRLTDSNLQVLCNLCNRGKGNWDSTDWRKK